MKQTCLIIKPKAAINPEEMVQAWSTLLLEGTEIEFCGAEYTMFPSLILSSFEGDVSARTPLSSGKVCLVCKVTLSRGCPSLLNFFIDLRLAKALILNLVSCRGKQICIKPVRPERYPLFTSHIAIPGSLHWLSFGVKALWQHSSQQTSHLFKYRQFCTINKEWTFFFLLIIEFLRPNLIHSDARINMKYCNFPNFSILLLWLFK